VGIDVQTGPGVRAADVTDEAAIAAVVADIVRDHHALGPMLEQSSRPLACNVRGSEGRKRAT